MLRLTGVVALALQFASIPSTFGAPAPYAWPGFMMGNNPWGVVLAPIGSSAPSGTLSEDGRPSDSSPPKIVYMTSFTTITVPLSTATDTPTTFDASSTLSPSSSVSTTVEAPPSSSSSDQGAAPPPESSTTSTTTDTTSVETPTETPSTTSTIPSPETTSTPPEPSSSSSSEPAATSTSGGNFNSDSNGSDASAEDVETYLSAHNTVRAQHGAPDLAWNNTLAAAAQKWSDGCVFQHSGGSVGPFGENIAAGSGDSYGITSAVTSWTNEASSFNPSSPSASHFTQVVWKATTQLGCALTTCPGGSVLPADFGDSRLVVCEYFPQGNVISDFAANVQA